MRTCFVCAALMTAVVPAGAAAQTAALTESEVIAQIGNESPRVQAARAGVDVARADILAAGRWPNPRFTFNREAVAGIAEEMFMVSQPLPITGRRQLDVRAATARVEASSRRAEEQIRRVRTEARLAFTDLWAAQERERELARGGERLNGLAVILAKREAAGDAAGFDRLRAEREVTEVETSRAVATAERAQAQAILAGFLAGPHHAGGIEAVRPVATPAAIPPLEDLMARAETSRGDLLALAREVEAAQFAGQSAGRRSVPEPEVVAGTKASNAAGGDVGSIFSVHVALPLFDRGQPERAAAQARGRQAQAEASVLRQTIRAQITGWRAAVVERREIADRHRVALQAADEIERIARISYEAGERGILELLDAFRTVSSARLRQAEVDAGVREAEIELAFASGWDIP
jgi:cobalt-zinc-cadmium efflux system outer membrane protein